MGRRRARGVVTVLLAALVAATAACGGEPPQPWADEAVEVVGAYEQAYRHGEPALRFYHPDVVVDGSTSTGVRAQGRDQLVAWARPGDLTARRIYLDRTGLAVVWEELAWFPREHLSDGLFLWEIDDSGLVTAETVLAAVATLGYPQWPRHEDVRRAVALAEEHVAAWSTTDAARIAALYAEDAPLVDTVGGVALDGRDAIAAHAASQAAPAVPAGRIAAREGDGGPGIYVRWPDGVDDMVAGRYQVAIDAEHDDGTGCPGRSVTLLSVERGRVAAERRYQEVDSARACRERGELPDGWWTGLEPPWRPESQVTGVVERHGRRVEIRNGSRGLERLAAWGLDRFAAAGLPLPDVDVVAFDAAAHAARCDTNRQHGVAVDTGSGTEVYLCVDESSACADAACRQVSSTTRHLMLHELAHPWIDTHVDAAARRAFLDVMGLEAWRDAEARWAERGVEQAANVIAWGVSDVPIDATGAWSCEELATAFEVLAGTPPRQDC